MQSSLDQYVEQRRTRTEPDDVAFGAGLLVPRRLLQGARLDRLQLELTLRPRTPFGESPPLPAYRIVAEGALVPRCWGLREYPDARDATSEGEPFSAPLQLAMQLLPEQVEPAAAALRGLRSRPHCAVLVLPCGAGKTMLALHAAVALGRRTLVLVHRRCLVEQWCRRIAAAVPDARVGLLHRGDGDIVVGTVQALARREDRDAGLDAFGTCVFDEAHHMAARSFSSVFFQLRARYCLGLTATPTRRDGLTRLLQWYLNCPAQGPAPAPAAVEVSVLRLWTTLPTGRVPPQLSARALSVAATKLCGSPGRNRLAVDCLVWASDRGRGALLLSSRLSHLQALLAGLTRRRPEAQAALYVGSMNQAERSRAEASPIILATVAMASEGLDIPRLDMLVLCAPVTDAAQAVGRVLRPHPGKGSPVVVVDMVDAEPEAFGRAAATRARLYAARGFRVETREPPESGLSALLDEAAGEAEQQAKRPRLS